MENKDKARYASTKEEIAKELLEQNKISLEAIKEDMDNKDFDGCVYMSKAGESFRLICSGYLSKAEIYKMAIEMLDKVNSTIPSGLESVINNG